MLLTKRRREQGTISPALQAAGISLAMSVVARDTVIRPWLMIGSVSPAPCQGEESILQVIAGLAFSECLFPLARAFPGGSWQNFL